MLNKMRNRLESEKGFTLIELLVVILIIGILAAIAIPSFLSQRVKGQDTCAKTQTRTTQTAEESYYTDNDVYTNSAANVNAIESAIADTAPEACDKTTPVALTTATPQEYVITSTSKSGNTFTVTRSSTGVISRTCAVGAGGNSGGCVGGTW